MEYRLLLSGHKPTFELFSFKPSTSCTELTLEKVSDSPAPSSATWLERHPTIPNVVYASSEKTSKVYALRVGDEVEVFSERDSGVERPVHLHVSNDGKSLVTGGLGSGETIVISLEPDGSFSKASNTLLTYPELYPYSNDPGGVPAKWPTRQKGPHVHGLTTDSKGRVYVCDLGSDAIWVAEPVSSGSDGKDGELKVVGMMERSRGDAPRHAVVSDDDQYLYVNSELQSELLIYSTTTLNIISRTDHTPPHLRPNRGSLLSAELYLHPVHKRTLYISNRGSKRLNRLNPELGPGTDMGVGEGDSITIVLLSACSGVEKMFYVETGLDWIRGMRISDDGNYLACAGEVGGGLEVYEIGGERGEVLNVIGRNEGVKNVNCVLWV